MIPAGAQTGAKGGHKPPEMFVDTLKGGMSRPFCMVPAPKLLSCLYLPEL
ncbi:hypothetical protein DESHY_30091 [Desulforamulus hydrothermalis Lam5 = DSM 18033]|uniref:Uncharacterized protein n=1 Tax=Desulforamulus hydrothermalis Lam5 = DSM 18033 TaxID=1121428 RepID=K8EIH6_9FIRM|nr:hypothetical protein DESHY_30088 [Desulforamulus hydrothermalis Lam5 = DSM 18033]CCO08401.1 hypothetical protein DESHY_30091 [Desulforamulus hydrothermalis Lam5 = DSM 18033]